MPGDPYQPPVVHPEPSLEECADDTPPPPVVVEHLRCTRPWVKFCSLAGFITSAFTLVIAFLAIRRMADHTPLPEMILIGGIFTVLAALIVIPSLWLSRYEKSITHLLISERMEDLELAISHQRAFWKQTAIMILTVLIIYLVTISISVLALLSSK